MEVTRSTRRHGISGESMRHAIANATRLIDTDDGVLFIGADSSGRLLELLARPTEAGELVVFHAMPPPTRQRQEVPAMTKLNGEPDRHDPTLSERLSAMTIAEIEAMSDQEVAELMGASADEFVTQPAWTWREAAKAATDEYAEKVAADIRSGRARVITDRNEIRRRIGGRPRVGGAPGEGPSDQVRVRVTTRTRTALEAIAAAQGRRLADVSRDALDEYVARHAS